MQKIVKRALKAVPVGLGVALLVRKAKRSLQ